MQEVYIQDKYKMVKRMVLAEELTQLVNYMKVCGFMERNTDLADSLWKMEPIMKDIIKLG